MLGLKKKLDIKVISKTTGITLDTIAKRYGTLPSKVVQIKFIDALDEHCFNLVVINEGIKEQNRQQKEAERKSKSKQLNRRRR